MTEPIRIKITHIHEEDAFFEVKGRWIGQEGEFVLNPPHFIKGYFGGRFHPDSREDSYYFLAIRYKKIQANEEGGE